MPRVPGNPRQNVLKCVQREPGLLPQGAGVALSAILLCATIHSGLCDLSRLPSETLLHAILHWQCHSPVTHASRVCGGRCRHEVPEGALLFGKRQVSRHTAGIIAMPWLTPSGSRARPPDACKKSHRERGGVTFAVTGIQGSGTVFGFAPVL